ncbi:pentapeptide repeat-containing protein [Streptomyces sp. BE230]
MGSLDKDSHGRDPYRSSSRSRIIDGANLRGADFSNVDLENAK